MNNPDSITTVKLTLAPIAPETTSSIKKNLEAVVEKTLSDAGRDNLIRDEKIVVSVEDTMPEAVVIAAIITFVGQLALETYKQLILPEIKRRYSVKEEEIEE